MEGIYIGQKQGHPWPTWSAIFAAGSLAILLLIGPLWAGLTSLMGLFLAGVALMSAMKRKTLAKPTGFPIILCIVHVAILVVSAVLYSMFLTPLSKSLRKIPILQTPYSDPKGVFSFKGPDGWDYRPISTQIESGVRLRPLDQNHYMGVSEVTLFVRKLESASPSAEEFLDKAADGFFKGQGNRKLFDLRTEKGESIHGQPIIWAELSVKRFWVPIYQVSIFGIKNDSYLCSVSATGLKSHSALSKLLCLGLFERIQVTQNH